MLTLTIRTDKPEAELKLFDGATCLATDIWQAHRQLAETIQQRIDELLTKQGKTTADVQGIVAYQGPGSFTGLRIGLSVANATAMALAVPIVGVTGENWELFGIERLLSGEDESQVMPEYGAPVHITPPKK